MIKITPVKQQTGGRFYPGDIARPGAFGAEGRGQEQFARSIQGAVNTLAKVWDQRNQLERNAGRILAKSEATRALQDAFSTALRNSNIDGTDLVSTFDKLAAPILSASKYDVGDTEKKYLIGMIGETANRIRTQAHAVQLKRQLQHTEIKVTDTKEASLADIDGPATLVEHIRNGYKLSEGVSKDSFLGQAVNKIQPYWAFDGVKKLIEKGVEKIKNEIREDPNGEIDAERWRQLHIYRRPRIMSSDITSLEELGRARFMGAVKGSTHPYDGTNVTDESIVMDKEDINNTKWIKYIQDRAARGLAIGYVDAQILANDGKMPKEVMHLGLDKQGADMAEALKKYIDGSKDTASNLAANLQQREVTKVARAGARIKSQVSAILMEEVINNPGNAKVWAEQLLAGKIPAVSDKRSTNPFDNLKKADREDYGENKPLVSQQVYSAIVSRRVGIDKANMKGVSDTLLKQFVNASSDPTGVSKGGDSNLKIFEKTLDSKDTIEKLSPAAWRAMHSLRENLKSDSKMTYTQKLMLKAFVEEAIKDFNKNDTEGFKALIGQILKFQSILKETTKKTPTDPTTDGTTDGTTDESIDKLVKVQEKGAQRALQMKFNRYDLVFNKAFEGIPTRGVHTHTNPEGKQYASIRDNHAWITMHRLLNNPQEIRHLDEAGAQVIKLDLHSSANKITRAIRNYWYKEHQAGRIDKATKDKKTAYANKMYAEVVAFTNILVRQVKRQPKQTRKPQSIGTPIGTPVPQGIPPYYLQRIDR